MNTDVLKLLKMIISHVLSALYQPFLFAFLLAAFYMFIWKHYSSVKAAVFQWVRWFRQEKEFRKMFVLAFIVIMILFRTLLNRDLWMNPLSNVIGVWGFWEEKNGEMSFTSEVPENIILFIPFIIGLYWNYKDRIFKNFTFCTVIWNSFKITFLVSLCIEFIQLFLRVGTWQLSDLFYNTIGGIIGGIIYWIGYKQMNKR